MYAKRASLESTLIAHAKSRRIVDDSLIDLSKNFGQLAKSSIATKYCNNIVEQDFGPSSQ